MEFSNFFLNLLFEPESDTKEEPGVHTLTFHWKLQILFSLFKNHIQENNSFFFFFYRIYL